MDGAANNSQARTKELSLNSSGWAGAELELEVVVLTSLVGGRSLEPGSANAGAVVEPIADFPRSMPGSSWEGNGPCAELPGPKKL